MTRRLPNCAGCGKPLGKSKGRMIHTFNPIRGVPMIGVCWDNADGDAEGCERTIPVLFGPHRVPLAPVLRMIAARGPGRVTLTYHKSLGREVSLDEACASAEARDKDAKR